MNAKAALQLPLQLKQGLYHFYIFQRSLNTGVRLKIICPINFSPMRDLHNLPSFQQRNFPFHRFAIVTGTEIAYLLFSTNKQNRKFFPASPIDCFVKFALAGRAFTTAYICNAFLFCTNHRERCSNCVQKLCACWAGLRRKI